LRIAAWSIGSINLSDKFTFTKVDGSPLKNVQLYARNGNVDFGALMDLKSVELVPVR